MKQYILYALLIVSVFMSGCEVLWDCLEGDGDVTTEERVSSSFTSIESAMEMDVTIRSGTTSKVLITTDQNLLNYIETTITDGKLKISVDEDVCINFSEESEIEITVPEVSTVILSGSGNISLYDMEVSSDFKAQNVGSGDITIRNLTVPGTLYTELVGSGNIWVKGKAENGDYYLSGSGDIDAESFRVFNCSATISGSGNMHAYVYDYLEAIITGSGDLYYYGNTAEVLERVSGSGSVIDASN